MAGKQVLKKIDQNSKLCTFHIIETMKEKESSESSVFLHEHGVKLLSWSIKIKLKADQVYTTGALSSY